ncbi:platelet-derived growth factor subunit B isoform X2 [Protopterus annectens]|uniref:platelet-derived growth factor subunit B isoform X2 n=1 Tax=Protopterus annectens TaxID=7888 RepID=UPI001CF9AC82|nr:platelet-derived growth factor subunit B isoform X2 [Protopterus annectens]
MLQIAAVLHLWYYFALAEQGEPIPEDIYHILGSSNIHSIDDLRVALHIDSVEEDRTHADEQDFKKDHTGSLRLPRIVRSLGTVIEPAVLAECKTRTEVFEITRSMVDPTNANFIVWPPCVEVQRCSGCCNTKNVQCKPSKVHVRHVQVTKIEYVRQRPVFKKVAVPLEDHLACRCEPVVHTSTRTMPASTTQAQAAVRNSTGIADHQQQPRRRKQRKHKTYRNGLSLKESLAT